MRATAHQIASASTTTQAVSATIARLNDDLANARTELATIKRLTKSDKGPSAYAMQEKIKSIEDQIAQQRETVGSSSKDAAKLSSLLQDYQTLEQDSAFADKLFFSAFQALEVARVTAGMQHSYVATFVEPHAAETAEYPKRLQGIAIVALVALFIWFVTLLAVYAVRDHAI